MRLGLEGCIGIGTANLVGAGGFTFAAGGSGQSKNIAWVLGFGSLQEWSQP